MTRSSSGPRLGGTAPPEDSHRVSVGRALDDDVIEEFCGRATTQYGPALRRTTCANLPGTPVTSLPGVHGSMAAPPAERSRWTRGERGRPRDRCRRDAIDHGVGSAGISAGRHQCRTERWQPPACAVVSTAVQRGSHERGPDYRHRRAHRTAPRFQPERRRRASLPFHLPRCETDAWPPWGRSRTPRGLPRSPPRLRRRRSAYLPGYRTLLLRGSGHEAEVLLPEERRLLRGNIGRPSGHRSQERTFHRYSSPAPRIILAGSVA